ncbi:hypothetical protein L1987_58551 [Smallanthus sonchifolius]|uniref:Uncharacterized protein n=1 Tax=Smallanthus sonchifolius TaxID=185202 RepID=A0ACB9DFN0_9ASTR|nr:hypothetical protein L1987_58551 [Smallanthus sonchifolius]
MVRTHPSPDGRVLEPPPPCNYRSVVHPPPTTDLKSSSSSLKSPLRSVSVRFHIKSWLPACSIVMECLAVRTDIDPNGEIMVLDRFCPLGEDEEQPKNLGSVKLVILLVMLQLGDVLHLILFG